MDAFCFRQVQGPSGRCTVSVLFLLAPPSEGACRRIREQITCLSASTKEEFQEQVLELEQRINGSACQEKGMDP